MNVYVASLLLLALLLMAVVHGGDLRQDVLEWALQNATRPEWMPPLEDYRPLVESFINTTECQAKINYVGIYYGSERAYDDSLGAYVFYLKAFDLLRYRALSMLINDRNLAGTIWLGTSDDLKHGVIVSGSPVFLIELDEDLFNKGYLFAKTIYVRLNETHLGNLTAFMHTTRFPAGVTNFTVHCPVSQTMYGLTTTVTRTMTISETITETRLVFETISIPFTITERVIETQTSVLRVTESITTTITLTESEGSEKALISLFIIVLIALTAGLIMRKK